MKPRGAVAVVPESGLQDRVGHTQANVPNSTMTTRDISLPFKTTWRWPGALAYTCNPTSGFNGWFHNDSGCCVALGAQCTVRKMS